MATLSKKFKKSSKSKSSSKSRKHFNKSRKNGLKTKKMRGGGPRSWFKKKPKPKPVTMAQPVTMVQPVTMAQPVTDVTSKIAPLPSVKKPMFWNTQEYKNALTERLEKYGPETSLKQLSKERLIRNGPAKPLKQLYNNKSAHDAASAAQEKADLLEAIASEGQYTQYGTKN